MLGYLEPQKADLFVESVLSVMGGMLVIISTVVYVYGRIKLKQNSTLTSTPVQPLPMSDGNLIPEI